jgi:hypothetical protein
MSARPQTERFNGLPQGVNHPRKDRHALVHLDLPRTYPVEVKREPATPFRKLSARKSSHPLGNLFNRTLRAWHNAAESQSSRTVFIDELMFAGDPMLLGLTPEQRLSETPGRGGPGIGTLRRKGKGWEATRDIHLGERIPGCEACGVTN